MSTADEATEKREKPIHENHYCMHEGCTKWGGWGFEMRYGTEWYCYEHRLTDYQGKR